MSISDDFKASQDEFDWSPYPTKENKKGWSAQMKRGIVVALTRGVLTYQDIKLRYKDISDEEINNWVDQYKKSGMGGLMITKAKYMDIARQPD